jgi:hypothetical protein
MRGGLHATLTDAAVTGEPDVTKSFLSIHAQASLSLFSDVHSKKKAVVEGVAIHVTKHISNKVRDRDRKAVPV